MRVCVMTLCHSCVSLRLRSTLHTFLLKNLQSALLGLLSVCCVRCALGAWLVGDAAHVDNVQVGLDWLGQREAIGDTL